MSDTTLETREGRIARMLFPSDYHDGVDCMKEDGREGEPCRICADARHEWIMRVRSVAEALKADSILTSQDTGDRQ